MVLKKMVLSLFLALIVGAVFFVPVAAAADYDGHWAKQSIDRALNEGWAREGGEAFRPNEAATRAEFVDMINRVMGYSAKADISRFTDVKPGDWYYDAFAVAVAAGYLTGYEDNTLRPNVAMPRVQAFAVFARLSKLNTNTDPTAFKTAVNDWNTVPAWAEGSVAAAISAGFVNGTGKGNISGSSTFTRAEAVVLLERLHDDVRMFAFPGTYSVGTVGSVYIQSGGVTLRNANVKGDLTIAEAVGDGTVNLDKVTVAGKLDVRGGGLRSVYIKDSKIAEIVITKDEVRVVFQDGSTATYVRVDGEDSIVEIGNGVSVDKITVAEDAAGTELVLNGGSKVDELSVQAENTNVTLSNGASVATVNVEKGADGTSIEMASGSKIATINIDASTDISGKGSIDKAVVSASGSETTIEQAPKNTTVNKDAENVVIGPAAPESTGGGGSKDNSGSTPATPGTAPTVAKLGTNMSATVTNTSKSAKTIAVTGYVTNTENVFGTTYELDTLFADVIDGSTKKPSAAATTALGSGFTAFTIPNFYTLLAEAGIAQDSEHTIVQSNPALAAYNDATAFPSNIKTKTYTGAWPTGAGDSFSVLLKDGSSTVTLKVYSGATTTSLKLTITINVAGLIVDDPAFSALTSGSVTTNHFTLAAAVTAAGNGGTVTLLEDNYTLTSGATVSSGVTLDLGAYSLNTDVNTLTIASGATLKCAADKITTSGVGKLVIVGGAIYIQTGAANGSGDAAFINGANPAITLETASGNKIELQGSASGYTITLYGNASITAASAANGFKYSTASLAVRPNDTYVIADGATLTNNGIMLVSGKLEVEEGGKILSPTTAAALLNGNVIKAGLIIRTGADGTTTGPLTGEIVNNGGIMGYVSADFFPTVFNDAIAIQTTFTNTGYHGKGFVTLPRDSAHELGGNAMGDLTGAQLWFDSFTDTPPATTGTRILTRTWDAAKGTLTVDLAGPSYKLPLRSHDPGAEGNVGDYYISMQYNMQNIIGKKANATMFNGTKDPNTTTNTGTGMYKAYHWCAYNIEADGAWSVPANKPLGDGIDLNYFVDARKNWENHNSSIRAAAFNKDQVVHVMQVYSLVDEKRYMEVNLIQFGSSFNFAGNSSQDVQLDTALPARANGGTWGSVTLRDRIYSIKNSDTVKVSTLILYGNEWYNNPAGLVIGSGTLVGNNASSTITVNEGAILTVGSTSNFYYSTSTQITAGSTFTATANTTFTWDNTNSRWVTSGDISGAITTAPSSSPGRPQQNQEQPGGEDQQLNNPTPTLFATITVADGVLANGASTGEFELGETVTVTATPEDGWSFVCWMDEKGEIVSEDAEYSFEVTGDITLTAVYSEDAQNS